MDQIIGGGSLPYFFIGMLDATLCLAIAVFWFQAPFRGTILTLFVTTSLFLIVVLGVGYFISASIRSQIGASRIALLVTMLPTTLLSGFAFPIDQMPRPVQVVTYLLGRRFLLEELIGVLLKDILPAGIGDLPVVCGRPVVFAGQRPNEALAIDRLTKAYRSAGVAHVALLCRALAREQIGDTTRQPLKSYRGPHCDASFHHSRLLSE